MRLGRSAPTCLCLTENAYNSKRRVDTEFVVELGNNDRVEIILLVKLRNVYARSCNRTRQNHQIHSVTIPGMKRESPLASVN